MPFKEKRDLQECPSVQRGYILPFGRDDTRPIVISQGYNGPHSHAVLVYEAANGKRTSFDDRFSLDFALPLGTIVTAARSGRVHSFSDCHDQWYEGLEITVGIKLWTNHLYLKHDDETFTLYSHLEIGAVHVEKGAYVERGTPLAVTGKSGWIGSTPHLHFAALRFDPPGWCSYRRTFPTIFEDYDGLLEHREIEEKRRT